MESPKLSNLTSPAREYVEKELARKKMIDAARKKCSRKEMDQKMIRLGLMAELPKRK